jgi:hypothetical protein
VPNLKYGPFLLREDIEFLGLLNRSSYGFLKENINTCQKEIFGYMIMRDGRNSNAHRLNLVQEIMVVIERLTLSVRSYLIATPPIDVHHPDELRLGDMGVLLRMDLTQIPNPYHTDLDLLRTHVISS